MSYEIKLSAAQINATHLKHAVYVDVHRADDAPNLAFVELESSSKMARLLCTDGNATWDCFGCVTVLNVLRNLRDEALRAITKRKKGKSANATVIAAELAVDNTYVEVSVPSIAQEPSRGVKVILTQIKSPVRMELTVDNMAWLSRVIAAERAAGVQKREEPTEKVAELRKMRDADLVCMGAGAKMWVNSSGLCRIVRPTDDDTGKRVITQVQATEQTSTTDLRSHAEAVVAGQVEPPKRRKLTQSTLTSMFGSGTSSAGSSSFDSASVAESDES
jgi:hypothetical protein